MARFYYCWQHGHKENQQWRRKAQRNAHTRTSNHGAKIHSEGTRYSTSTHNRKHPPQNMGTHRNTLANNTPTRHAVTRHRVHGFGFHRPSCAPFDRFIMYRLHVLHGFIHPWCHACAGWDGMGWMTLLCWLGLDFDVLCVCVGMGLSLPLFLVKAHRVDSLNDNRQRETRQHRHRMRHGRNR